MCINMKITLAKLHSQLVISIRLSNSNQSATEITFTIFPRIYVTRKHLSVR